MVPAVKFPELSLATMVFSVDALVAFTVHVTAVEPLNNVPLRYPAPAIEVYTWVAVPLRVAYTVFAVMIPALKFPELSLATMVFVLSALVALTVQVTAVEPLNNVPLR